MSYKSLNLEQVNIGEAIHQFAQEHGGKVVGPIEKPRFDEFQLCIEGQKPALLHLYKNKDGSTTLMPSVGQNQALSEELAKYVVAITSRQDAERRPLTLGSLPQDTWDFLREILESNGCEIQDQPLQHGVRISVIGPQRDQVFLHRYNSGKFMMQGRPMAVYAMVSSLLAELHEDKREVLQAQLEVVQVGTNLDDLYEELQQHLPTAAAYLGDTGCAVIAPALALVKIAGALPDFSFVAFPALRGLELYMKQLLVDNQHPVSAKQGLGAFFTQQGALLSGCAAKIGCSSTIYALETSYALHGKHRNGLFHADGQIPAMTRIVEEKREATDIVYNVLRTIEVTYAAIPQKTL